MPRSASNRFGAKLLYAYRTYRLPAFIFYPKLYTITEKTNIKVFGKGSGVTPRSAGRCLQSRQMGRTRLGGTFPQKGLPR